MNHNDVLSKVDLTEAIKSGVSNLQDDQAWGRTLKTRDFRANCRKTRCHIREIIGVCNYGNLYFVILAYVPRRKGTIQKCFWIRKTDVGKKYKTLDLTRVPIEDGVLGKHRETFWKEMRRGLDD